METLLQAINDNANSFYGKARVTNENGTITLISYTTKVAQIKDGKATVFNTHSQTTLRHIKEFLKQNGFIAENKAQILEDYKEVA